MSGLLSLSRMLILLMALLPIATCDYSLDCDPSLAFWLAGDRVADASFSRSQVTSIGSAECASSLYGVPNTCLLDEGKYIEITASDVIANFPIGRSARSACGFGYRTWSDFVSGWIIAYGKPSFATALVLGAHGTRAEGGGFFNDILIDNAWPEDVWKHICLTWDNATTIATLYLEGVQQQAGVFDSWDIPSTDILGYVGPEVFTPPSEFWIGGVYDVRVYSRVLTSTEVLTLATSNPATRNLTCSSATERNGTRMVYYVYQSSTVNGWFIDNGPMSLTRHSTFTLRSRGDNGARLTLAPGGTSSLFHMSSDLSTARLPTANISITGLTMTLYRNASAIGFQDVVANVVVNGVVFNATNQCSEAGPACAWATSMSDWHYGSTTYKWNTKFTPAMVNFGWSVEFQLQTTNTANFTVDGFIDLISFDYHYIAY